MKIYETTLTFKTYQQIKIPEGCAPLSVTSDRPSKMTFYYGSHSLMDVKMMDVGVYIIRTGEEFPEGISIVPSVNSLQPGKVIPPNARWVGTVNDHHIVFGPPKLELAN